MKQDQVISEQCEVFEYLPSSFNSMREKELETLNDIGTFLTSN